MKNERDAWILVGKLAKSINNDLLDLKKASGDMVSGKTKRHLSEALDSINDFRNKAENEMLLSGIDELAVFYGQEDPEKTIDKFLKESELNYTVNERIRSSILYDMYLEWSHINNLKPMTITSFGIEMSKKFKKVKSDGIFYVIDGDPNA